jgi:sulfite exporter TauE/SafE
MNLPAEAFLLGISSGPACLASCGPVLLPALAAERGSPRRTMLLLTEFLAGRLAGYLAFAASAWSAGLSLSTQPQSRIWVFGFANLGLAVLLAAYAFALPRTPAMACGRACARYKNLAPAVIGVVTGINLCPPFLAAGVRAIENASLAGALLFFLLFFLGTSIWFVPSVSLGLLRRFEAVSVVARFTLFLLAAYYGYLALITLGRAWIHGR